ncbi:hypothetical protein [Myxococcus llanfairpwllgwyngyllgogerychwyrndrobwllllantysiliogogogochensis]|uniref:Lipoprotein n=1 Tax=Myxococcus llanfairpwllgwyngyllgogerychwyrndrobwllllantysiliogogogochensis TaxID=2590453 RepID=A0A540WM37_9BACT|nr:hypothetical protein [Myxococcus llanfairpwllgwyngyllgogerychwyrndrobwllllantysiliogogogochensis]NTX01605.1 hypothetical protein [Myxococcus sp. CA040A]TQF09474.1 hypothetical protein FJV41_44385 [Myxococcus llanfairpwllgwyngyllgogerychwyrndrobwllllantysiliogogogochensis]
MKKLLATGALLGMLSGCSTTPPTIGEQAPTLHDENAEAAYRALLDKYSGQQQIYDGFDTRLFAGVTLQSMAFREARVKRQAAFQVLPPPKVEQLLSEERTEAGQVHEFFLGVHVNDYRYLDFDFKKTIWRMALVTPAGEVTPVRIRRLGRADLEMRAYYPYTSVFWVGYEVQFPTVMSTGQLVIPPGTEQVTFRLASSLGQAEMKVAAQ